MKRSRGELRAELLKAGRGAGLPLGIAEDVAAATDWIDVAALQDTVQVLEHPQGIARLGALIEALDQRALGQGVSPPSLPALWQALQACQDNAPRPQDRLDIPKPLWSRLSALAARTYVPETDQSRRSGAGAGDIDND